MRWAAGKKRWRPIREAGWLSKHLRERLAFRESRRVGQWVLAEKKRELSTANDAFLLNEVGFTLYNMGDQRKAIEYFEQALTIDRNVYGESHPKVAIRLNNLGSAWQALGDQRKAIAYYEQALTIDRNVYGDEHPNVAIRLNNLGSTYLEQGQKEKAKAYLEQAYKIKLKFYGPEHPHTKATAEWLAYCEMMSDE